jgi:hypothetical protein
MDIVSKNSDDKLKQLIGESKLEMPFSDFEDRLMSRINSEVSNEKAITKNIRLSWLFFGLGTLFGILLTIILNPTNTIMGIPLSKFIIPLYVTGATLFFLMAEQLLTLNHKKQH